ncbi:hypothetical protein ACKKBG_A28340 [Auxenochlorella protothecoides x Auxenochlorella symbiontica]|nr:hypothetical protein F751_5775 [Auxenochlorella protothecoides]KFM29337.1 hypothetical protein F751_5775 [Auxenochlorella protothecoides]
MKDNGPSLSILRSAVLPALGGYLFTFYNSKKADERKAQIQRINDQVRLLYGPLLACVHASRAAYAAMVRQHSPDGTVGGFLAAMRRDPKGHEGSAYRHWMKDVMQPLNERAADIIVDHVNLLESAEIDPRLLQLVAHVSAYKVIISRWDRGAVGEWSAISYPNTLLDYVRTEFQRLKRRQAELLGIKRPAKTAGKHAAPSSANGDEAIVASKASQTRSKL